MFGHICVDVYIVDNRTLRFSNSARGIVHGYHLPHMPDESATAELAPVHQPRESTFHFAVHPCTCNTHYPVFACNTHSPASDRIAAGITYERSTAWKHVTKLLADTGRTYSVHFQLFLARNRTLTLLSHPLVISRKEIKDLLTINYIQYK